MPKKALITGITGQDAAYLTQLLLEKGYQVYGSRRRGSTLNTWRLEELGIHTRVKMIEMDLVEYSNIMNVIKDNQFDEIYNLAAQSFVTTAFLQPIYTSDVDGVAVCRILEAIRHLSPHTRFYQASSSEMFGKVQEMPQKESTPFYPRSPYGVAKIYGHWITVNYREAYGLHCTSGILFNHESPLRGQEFVTRKISTALAKIKNGLQDELVLGNMDAKRDWGFAGDYVRGMHMMLQYDKPDNYVLATGECHTIRSFVEQAARVLGYDVEWEGKAEKEIGRDKKTGKLLVKVNPEFYRPSEVDVLMGDASKAKNILGWKPEINFPQLVEMMVTKDMDRIARGRHLQ